MRIAAAATALIVGWSAGAEPGSPAARAAEARAAGRLEEAVAAYREALTQRPSWLEGKWHLAATLHEAGHHEEAAEAFAEVLSVKPDTGAGWILLGVSEYKLGRYDEALEHLRQGRALGAASDLLSTAHYYLALLMNRSGEHEAALQLLDRFAADGNRSPSVLDVFGLAVLRRRVQPAEVPASDAAKVRAAGEAAFLVAARQVKAGRRAMEALSERHPDDLDVRYALGALLAGSDPDLARAHFEAVLERRPSDHDANLVLGGLLLKQRQTDAALPRLERAVAVRPASARAHYMLGSAKLAAGDPEDARRSLERAVGLEPAFVAARALLAKAYYRLGRKPDGDREAKAVREIEAARQADMAGTASSQPGRGSGR